MKITHKQKIKKARSLRTKQEIKNNVPLFQTKAWESNKLSKQRSIEVRIKKVKSRAKNNYEKSKNMANTKKR